MNKYEKLIEYVINEEFEKAEDLFHEIVVEKSRSIYESIMDMDELGGDESDDFIDDIEADEESMYEDDEEMDMGGDEEMDMDDDMGMDGDEEMDMGMDDEGEESLEDEVDDLEDRMVNVEDEIDALVAKFDAMMNGDEEMDDEMGDEEMDMDDEMGESLEESMELNKVSAPSNSEESFVNKKSANANNSGGKNAVAKPQQSKGEEGGRSAPEVKDGNGTTKPNMNRVNVKTSKEPGEVNKKSISGS